MYLVTSGVSAILWRQRFAARRTDVVREARAALVGLQLRHGDMDVRARGKAPTSKDTNEK